MVLRHSNKSEELSSPCCKKIIAINDFIWKAFRPPAPNATHCPPPPGLLSWSVNRLQRRRTVSHWPRTRPPVVLTRGLMGKEGDI